MSKRKGVSAEEKKTRLQQLFYEKKEFFQLKELEKIAPKEKGIISNSVKDTLESLVDDGLVDTDKIGTSVYFWAYPSKAEKSNKRKLLVLNERYTETTKRLKTVSEKVTELKAGREECEERSKVLDKVMTLQLEKDEYLKKLQLYNENDPDVLRKMKKQISLLKEGVNRWTDNIFSAKAWCRNKFNIDDQVFEKQFGIPSDFDYLE